jgi:predicted lysophospholipase L1 biosynthesis ABC-type transport system permease subunit
MVSESVARRLWPGQDPLGKRIRTGAGLPSGAGWRTVVGVVSDLRFRTFRESSPTVFLPWRQAWWQGWVAVRTSGDLAAALPAMRASLHEMDPLVGVSQAQTMDELLSAPLAEPKLSAFLLSGFGLVALALAAIGLYGMMAAAVREQTREMGIRMVLGARPVQMRNGVLREALGIVAAGGIIGLAVALGSARLLTAVLFQVSPLDPVALSSAVAVLVVVGVAAAYLPARRATTIDPASVLRGE